MIVNVRFICKEIVGDARKGAYEIAEPADVAALMDVAAKENGSFIAHYPDYLIYLVNGSPATAATVLKDGDQLTVLRKVLGG